tara:strand:+ start:145 stop:438 length:294 start_codon:yes stop_codon:yes gene_type:complete
MSKPVIRFRRASLPLATIEADTEETLLEAARRAGIDPPSNCTSGICGTCMMRLVSGELEGLNPLPPGLDEEIVANGAILACIVRAVTSCEIDVLPPL